MTALVIRGDAAHLPLPDASVDLIVTSPPYYGLRSYTDGGEHYAGQIGSEATPAEYVAALVACTAEWVRVLKPTGSLFVNLGDKYAGGGGQWDKDERPDPHRRRAVTGKIATGGNCYGMKPKSLLGLPWRYALAVIDQLGLILRAEIIWAKPNGLPESVTDRVRRSHEQWFHFTVQPRYYAAVDEIRTLHEASTLTRGGGRKGLRIREEPNPSGTPQNGRQDWEGGINALGALPGSVWSIPSQPLTVPPTLGVDHFAAFPMEWPRRIIAGWSPPGICTACGEGRRPVSVSQNVPWATRSAESQATAANAAEGGRSGFIRDVRWMGMRRVTVTGYACACPAPTAPTRPAVVLDPFGGTGTTALLATTLGRTGISIDRSADYSRLARWRTTDPGQRAEALQVGKPPVEVDGQLDMFDEGATA